MPSISRSYWNLLFTSRKGIPKDGVIPQLSLSINDFIFDQEHLQAYKELCLFKTDGMPLTYPYCVAGPLQLALAANKGFPIKSAGLLHLRNHIQQIAPIPINTPMSITVQTAEARFRPQGFEFDMKTIFKSAGEEIWACTSTFLKRGRFDTEDPQSPQEDIFKKLPYNEDPASIEVPSNIGRQYASLCKDYNPIHISSLLAKLFGFKRSIAHGMWVSAASLSLLDNDKPKSYDLAFKGPVYTSSSFSVITDPNGMDFNIYTSKNPKPVILAKVT